MTRNGNHCYFFAIKRQAVIVIEIVGHGYWFTFIGKSETCYLLLKVHAKCIVGSAGTHIYSIFVGNVSCSEYMVEVLVSEEYTFQVEVIIGNKLIDGSTLPLVAHTRFDYYCIATLAIPQDVAILTDMIHYKDRYIHYCNKYGVY